MTKRIALAALVFGLCAAPAAAQGGLGDVCAGVPSDARGPCLLAAQAVESGQPQLGILIAAGNPTPGTASTGGIRLGLLPRVSGTVRANAVRVRLPELLQGSTGSGTQTLVAPALGADLSIGVFPGVSLAPTIGGVGAVDLLGSTAWVPVRADGLDRADASWGVGARVGLLRESFVTPGVSVSVMYRKLGRVSFGDVCDGVEQPSGTNESRCFDEGDHGEFAFDLADWSTRLAASKRLLGLGLTAGVGYDRFRSDVDVGFRAPGGLNIGGTRVFRFQDVEVRSSRLSAFVDASYTLLVGTLTAEVGWMRGGDGLAGFSATGSGFDPGGGTAFASVAARLSL